MQSGMELVEVQKIFGHADIDSTSIYTQLEDKAIYDMVIDKHILGKKK